MNRLRAAAYFLTLTVLLTLLLALALGLRKALDVAALAGAVAVLLGAVVAAIGALDRGNPSPKPPIDAAGIEKRKDESKFPAATHEQHNA